MTLETKISARRARQIARSLVRSQELIGAKMKKALDTFFRAQATRAVAVFLGGSKAAPDGGVEYKNLNPGDIIPPSDDAKIVGAVRPFLLQMTLSSSEISAELVGTAPITATSPEMVKLLQTAGKRIRRINTVTRQAVRATLSEGLALGLSDFQIARGVRELRDSTGTITRQGFTGLRSIVEETYKDRSLTISRTEMGITSTEAAAERYADAGVTKVDIIDGPDCGWTFHDDGDIADGSTRTVAELRATPLSHPNCVRVGLPVL